MTESINVTPRRMVVAVFVLGWIAFVADTLTRIRDGFVFRPQCRGVSGSRRAREEG
jgi:hypothetical protein